MTSESDRREGTLTLKLTPENVADALYEINKAAKRYRDRARSAVDYVERREHFTKRDDCYSLKNRVLIGAIRRGWATLDCVHRIARSMYGYSSEVHYACIRIGERLFHMAACYVGDEHTLVDLPSNWISPAVPEGTVMPLESAMISLERFLADETDDGDSEVSLDGVILREESGSQVPLIEEGEMDAETYEQLKAEIDELENRIDDLSSRIVDRNYAKDEDESEYDDAVDESDDDNDFDTTDDEDSEIWKEIEGCEGGILSLVDDYKFRTDLAEKLDKLLECVWSLKSDHLSGSF